MAGPFLPFFGDTEKIVENGDFSQVNMLGLPVGWNYRADSADWIKIKKSDDGNYLELNVPAGKTIHMIQYLAEFEAGRNYIIRWKSMGDVSAKYRIYIEWHDKNKTKEDAGFLRSVNGQPWRTLEREWAAHDFKFTAFGKEYVDPYFVINVKGPGIAAFTDLEIIKAN